MIGRRTTLLARTFFDRMFDNEWLSSSASASNAVLWLLAAVATPGVMVSASQYYFYAHARTFTPETQDRILFVSQVFHVDFAMAMAGIVTMLVWTSLAPDRRDALVLGVLPVSSGEQARARLLALGSFFGLFAVAVSVPTAVAFTFVTVGDAHVAEVPGRVAGHIAGTLLGAGFVFAFLSSLQLLLAATFGPRAVALATWPLQVAALLAMVAAVSSTGRLADALLSPEALRDTWVMWSPPAWFVGIYRSLGGDQREVFTSLSTRGVAAAAMTAALTLLVYPFAYRRSLDNAIRSEGRSAMWWSGLASRLWLRAMKPFLRTPLERGLAAFMIANWTRSPAHRFLIGSYLGISLVFALPLAGRLLQAPTSAAVQYAWFSIPLGLVCWTAAAVRVAMMMPIEPGANWLFKLTEPVDKARVLSSAVTVTQGAVALPVSAAFGVAAAMAGDGRLGALVFAVVLMTGSALIELLMVSLRMVPGTCTYRPGQLWLRVLWPVYVITWVAVAYLLPTIAVRALADTQAALIFVTGLVVLWLALRTWRVVRARAVHALVYEEAEPSATTTVRLGPAGA